MNIQTLHNLVHQFPSQEQILIRHALKASKEGDENKSLQLFDFIITQKKNVSRKAASLAIYNTLPNSRVNKLISRLWDKVLNIISSENFLKKNERLEERSFLRIAARKKVLQSTVLLYLNSTSYAYSILLDEAIREAQKSESHIMLIELYSVKKQLSTFFSDRKEYDFYERQMFYYKKCHDTQELILRYYSELIKNDGYGNHRSTQQIIKFLERAFAELKGQKKYIATSYSKYLFSLMQLEYLFCKENYTGAKKFLGKILRDIDASLLIRGNSHTIARVEAELGICELYLGNYDKAIKHTEKGLALLWERSKMNYYVSLEGLFELVFYKKDFDRAEKIAKEFLSADNPMKNVFRISKPSYFQSCIHFKRKEYKEALKIINKSMPLNKDKTGYDIAVRILRIQCLLELERFDEASAQIENLRKHVSRNYKKMHISGRNIMISRVLILMRKRGFSGKQNKTESAIVKKLWDSTGKYKWKPKTPELIRFHEWYSETNLG